MSLDTVKPTDELSADVHRVNVPSTSDGTTEVRDARVPLTQSARKGMRLIYFDGANASQASVYERDGLDVGVMIQGPAVVEQFDATTVVPPGWTGRVDQHRNLVLEKGAA